MTMFYPLHVSATDGAYSDKVRVTWDAVPGVTSYEVWRDTSTNTANAAYLGETSTNAYDDTSATYGITYNYWVKSKYAGTVSGLSGSDSGWRLGPPTAPGGVSASDGTYSEKVQVTWNAVGDATGYMIWRNTTDNSATATQIGTADSTTFDDTAAAANVTYYYWLKATNAVGSSGFSASDSGWRLGPPTAPSGVSATDGTYSEKVQVTWNTVGDATGYEVWRNLNNDSGSASKLADSSTALYDDNSATAGITYYYWAKAKNAAGTSDFSTSDSGYRAGAAPTNNLPAPTGVTATDGTYSNKVNISWSVVSGAISYEVFRNTDNNSGASAKIAEVYVTACDDSNVTVNVSYYYWIKAKNADGASGFSSPDSGYAADNQTPTGNADLSLTSLIFLPNRLNAGDHPGILSMVLINNGPESLALLNKRIAMDVYLSPDTTLGNGDDLWLGDYQMDVNLSAGYRTTISASGANRDRLTIPSTAAGQYYVFAKVRHAAPSTLGDPNSANNFVMCANTITISSSGVVYHPINDYDGDGKSDAALYEAATGFWYIFGSTVGFISGQFGDDRFLPCPGDYDGDGKSDFLVYTELYGGYWMVYFSESQTIEAFQGGGVGYVPLRGDFDGDGKSDYAVYEEATGNWIMLLSTSGQLEVRFFGAVGYDHVSGDFDGDGKTDPALYHASDSYWFWLPAGAQMPDFQYFQFGWPGSTPIPGDYDGDGTTDLAVYHPSHGWAMRYSSGGEIELPVTIVGTPVVGDYDGDGKVDIAIYLPSGQWIIKLSTTGQIIQGQFGGLGQVPVQ